MNNINKKISMSFVAYFIMVIINTLGAFGFINGLSQKEVSNEFDTMITPAGFTFSIWGVIYSLLLITLVVAFVNRDKTYYKNFIERISFWFVLSCVFNILWNVVFAYRMIALSLLMILGLLFTLVAILRNLQALRDNSKWVPALSFGLYAGWIFIASFVNFSAFLVSIDFNYFGSTELVFSIAVVVVASLLAIGMVRYHQNAIFPLAIAWAYFGGMMELKKTGDMSMLGTLLLITMAVMIVVSAYMLYKNRALIGAYSR
ncbi:MAG: hypothetical protein Q4D65_01090 [Peptostreptococcaceae bacterium]|nr:hypothetical protein [Peptostreptococcaceae bacterium]